MALAGLIGQYGSGDSSADEEDPKANSAIDSMWSTCVDPATGCPYYWNQITNEVSWEPPKNAKANTAVKREIKHPKPTTTTTTVLPVRINAKKEDSVSEEEEEKIELITSYYNSDSGSGDEHVDNKNATKSSSKLTKRKTVQVRDEIKYKKPPPNAPTTYGPEIPKEFKANIFSKSVTLDATLQNKVSSNLINISTDMNVLNNETFRANASKTAEILNSKMAEMAEYNKRVHKNIGLLNKSASSSPNNTSAVKKAKMESSIDTGEERSNPNTAECENSSDTDNKNSPVLEAENLDDLMITQATLLKKLGKLGPNEIKYLNGSSGNSPIVSSRTQSPLGSPNLTVGSPAPMKKSNALDMDVDDLIAQIEMEQPIDQPSVTSDVQSNETQDGSVTNKSLATEDSSETKTDGTFKPLFPSATFSDDKGIQNCSDSISATAAQNDDKNESQPPEKHAVNKYDLLSNDGIENSAFKRKRRIALDILPSANKHPKPDLVQNPEFHNVSGERKGFGFKTDASTPVADNDTEKGSGSYISFQKGDALNAEAEKDNSAATQNGDDVEEEKFDGMDDKKTLIEAKLKFLIQSLPPVPPVQQLFVELQTLWGALASGELRTKYMHEWLHTADSTLGRLEASAAPHPWICRFHSEAGCYVYEHSETGQWQWEYPEPKVPPPPASSPPPKPPAPPSPSPDEPTDMDISTTPPPQSHGDIRSGFGEDTEPLPPGVETPGGRSSPSTFSGSIMTGSTVGYSNMSNMGSHHSGLPRKDNINAELDSFYSDLAALEEVPSPAPATDKPTPCELAMTSLANVPIPPVDSPANLKEKKKKIKVKTPGVGMKSKNVSSLVAKWKKVQESLGE